ncbi:hypothetical protein [Nonomuraea sp. LPB2021202275-12-8]|uniref:hypothetical protein n=1 Tax=Nonomuraea sp. LPB2021202275-12-8 TaxID=3120159 RepID=UPI00300D1351
MGIELITGGRPPEARTLRTSPSRGIAPGGPCGVGSEVGSEAGAGVAVAAGAVAVTCDGGLAEQAVASPATNAVTARKDAVARADLPADLAPLTLDAPVAPDTMPPHPASP